MLSNSPSRVYLAGPMTGLPEFNYPAFNAEAARLRALGYQVENPAENPLPAEAPWHQCMRAAIARWLSATLWPPCPAGKNREVPSLRYLADRLGIPSVEAASLTVHQTKPSAEQR
jgi:hypothetical protein